MELAQRRVPLARLGELEEVAEAVLYLATASFCTGTILNISGGMYVQSCADLLYQHSPN